MLTVADLLAQEPVAPGRRIPYGPEPSQFGELFLPDGNPPWAVIALIHGGCWLADYDLSHLSPLASALTTLGVAVWNLEYRRVGERGGGWPGTFRDVAAGIAHLRSIAGRYPLDLTRLIVAGHSAGGHLALWAAGWRRWQHARVICPPGAYFPTPRGVLALAGIPDLAQSVRAGICEGAIVSLLGADLAARSSRMELSSPRSLLPLGVSQVLLYGEQDEIVPPQHATGYTQAAVRAGDEVHLFTLPDAGHYEPVIPYSSAWRAVCTGFTVLLQGY